MHKLRLAVIGAGAIGRTHIALVRDHALFALSAIVDNSEAARVLAAQIGVAYHEDVAAMLSSARGS